MMALLHTSGLSLFDQVAELGPECGHVLRLPIKVMRSVHVKVECVIHC